MNKIETTTIISCVGLIVSVIGLITTSIVHNQDTLSSLLIATISVTFVTVVALYCVRSLQQKKQQRYNQDLILLISNGLPNEIILKVKQLLVDKTSLRPVENNELLSLETTSKEIDSTIRKSKMLVILLAPNNGNTHYITQLYKKYKRINSDRKILIFSEGIMTTIPSIFRTQMIYFLPDNPNKAASIILSFVQSYNDDSL